jgi:hypothetical protein
MSLGPGERSFQGVSNDGGGIAVLISVKTSRFTVHGVSARPPACRSRLGLYLHTMLKCQKPSLYFQKIKIRKYNFGTRKSARLCRQFQL